MEHPCKFKWDAVRLWLVWAVVIPFTQGSSESSGEKGHHLLDVCHVPGPVHHFILTAPREGSIISSFLQMKKASLRETKTLPKVSGRAGIQKSVQVLRLHFYCTTRTPRSSSGLDVS